MSGLVGIGAILVLAFFAVSSREDGIYGAFHATMVLWFLGSLGLTILVFTDIISLDSLPTWLTSTSFLGLLTPIAYFVMRGGAMTWNDVRSGVQKVNRHLDQSQSHHTSPSPRQYAYDEDRDQWYVFAAHIEQWKPCAPPR